MAITTQRKNLGQLQPSGGFYETLFECPAASDAVCSSIVLCNQDAGISIVSIKNPLFGEASDNKEYLVNDLQLEGKETLTLTLGVCFSEGDKLDVYSDTGNVSFNMYGQLNTQSSS